MDGWTDGRTDGRTDGQTDGQTDGWMERAVSGVTGSPTGLAITREGHLVVAECYKHCSTIINSANGRKIRSLGQEIYVLSTAHA